MESSNKYKSFDSFIDSVVSSVVDDALVPNKVKCNPLYSAEPVSLVTFATDYLNLKDELFPNVIKILSFIDNPLIREVYLILGKGSGKSTILVINSLYGIYLWSLMRNPYEYFHLLRTSKVACVNVSPSREQAQDVVFEGCLRLTERCSFFKNKFEAFKNYIVFDSGITLYAGHGNAAAWLGYATFRGGLDECEFMMDNQNRSQAQQLYNALRGSLRTRFPKDYKLVAISSCKERHSFLMRKASSVLVQGSPIIFK